MKVCVGITSTIRGANKGPPTHTYAHFLVGDGGTWVQKLPTLVFNSDLGNFILKRNQTEHNFEMQLIKWENLLAPFQTSSQGENTSNRNLNDKLRLTVTKSEISKSSQYR